MRGQNPIRQPVHGDGLTLEVQSIFPTLQGEGPYAGIPAVFVRLGGCNLACHFCDTEFENFSVHALESMLKQINELALDSRGIRVRTLVVITGGEPLRQNIVPLCEQLIAHGLKVQVETNGTLFRPLPPGVDVICSPKNAGRGYFPVREDLLARITAFKFIISRHDERYNHVAEIGQAVYHTPVYVQPMDDYDNVRNAENVAYALRLAQEHGYRMSLQLHKLLGIA